MRKNKFPIYCSNCGKRLKYREHEVTFNKFTGKKLFNVSLVCRGSYIVDDGFEEDFQFIKLSKNMLTFIKQNYERV